MKIVVLSTFDIWPPRDGGQRRYCELWRQFSLRHDIAIVAYEFRNTDSSRTYKLAPNVEVHLPVAEQRDASCFNEAAARTGLWLHDVLCIRNYRFSDEFLARLSIELATADVVVASHPYLAHVAFPMARPSTLKVYESYNVEIDIKTEYLRARRQDAYTEALLDDVRWVEAYAAAQSDLISAVSRADRQRFLDIYSIDPRNMIVIPNGTDIPAAVDRDASLTTSQRIGLGINKGLVGVFIGSAFEPNVVSYRQARDMLETVGFDGTIILVGSIADAERTSWPTVRFKEVWLGFVDDAQRDAILQMADFALHLIFAGAGTNLKLFDYMGASIPIIANTRGIRGCDDGRPWFFDGETADALKSSLQIVAGDPEEARRRGDIARRIAKDQFSWAAIAREFERALVFGADPLRQV